MSARDNGRSGNKGLGEVSYIIKDGLAKGVLGGQRIDSDSTIECNPLHLIL